MIGVITMLADRAAVGLQPGRKLGKDGRERLGEEKNKLKYLTCDMFRFEQLVKPLNNEEGCARGW